MTPRLDIPAATENAILVVTLADFWPMKGFDKFGEAVATSASTSSTHVTLVPDPGPAKTCPTIEVPQENYSDYPVYSYLPQRSPQLPPTDLVADVYDAACRAFAQGWRHLAVADDLTVRQVEGHPRDGEDAAPSLIVLQLSSSERGICVRAKRYRIYAAIRVLVDGSDLEIPPPQLNGEYDEMEVLAKHGMYLHNPTGVPFCPSAPAYDVLQMARSSREAAYALAPSLPPEITTMIEALVAPHIDPAVEKVLDTPARLSRSKNFLEVQALVPIADFGAAQAKLKAAVRAHDMRMNVALFAWPGGFSASRAEVLRLAKGFVRRGEKGGLYGFFLTKGWDDEGVIEVTVAKRRGPGTVDLCRMKVGVAAQFRKENGKELCEAEVLQHERIFDPSARFFAEKPAWAPENDEAVVVVFLTSKVDGEDVEEFKRRMELGRQNTWGANDDNFPYHFVEWESDEDGQESDMLRIGMEVEFDPFQKKGEALVFVDADGISADEVYYTRYVHERKRGESQG